MAATVATWLFGGGATALGFVVAAAGVLIVAWAARALGPALTPYPTPSRKARLATGGPFRFVRHPIYVGGTLVFGGLSLALSTWGLLGTAALALFWVAKARHEECLLVERFPEYAEYRARTLF